MKRVSAILVSIYLLILGGFTLCEVFSNTAMAYTIGMALVFISFSVFIYSFTIKE